MKKSKKRTKKSKKAFRGKNNYTVLSPISVKNAVGTAESGLPIDVQMKGKGVWDVFKKIKPSKALKTASKVAKIASLVRPEARVLTDALDIAGDIAGQTGYGLHLAGAGMKQVGGWKKRPQKPRSRYNIFVSRHIKAAKAAGRYGCITELMREAAQAWNAQKRASARASRAARRGRRARRIRVHRPAAAPVVAPAAAAPAGPRRIPRGVRAVMRRSARLAAASGPRRSSRIAARRR